MGWHYQNLETAETFISIDLAAKSVGVHSGSILRAIQKNWNPASKILFCLDIDWRITFELEIDMIPHCLEHRQNFPFGFLIQRGLWYCRP